MISRWVVHKFGGTSVADAERYRAAAGILLSRGQGERTAVVVSAMSGVTDTLIRLVELAASQNGSYLAELQSLKERHLDTVAGLHLDVVRHQSLVVTIASDFKEIEEVLRGAWITRLASERIKEFVAGHGEVWSAQLLHAHLECCGHSSAWLDARRVLVVESDSRTIAVDWQLSQEKLQDWQGGEEHRMPVIPRYM